jgi:hypothetical protein
MTCSRDRSAGRSADEWEADLLCYPRCRLLFIDRQLEIIRGD